MGLDRGGSAALACAAVAGTNRTARRHVFLCVVAVAGVALVAGCGSSSSTTTTVIERSNVPEGLSATMTPKGPRDIAANVAWLAAKNQPQLTHFAAACPKEPTPPVYPVKCRMTAIDTSKLNKRTVPDGKHRRVAGFVTIDGVYPPTRTYAYTVTYQPVSRR
jgi:hypothetical protein